MDKERIEALTNILAYEYENMGGMIILKDGHKLYEHYFHGCTKESTLHVFSVTKSIVSCLIGIAMDQGLITSLDQKVIDFFPEFGGKENDERSSITIKDLLTMHVSYRYKDGPIAYMKYFMAKDWVKFTLNQWKDAHPDGGFRYTPLIGPDLLTGLLTRVTGASVLQYAQEHLFEPMGIHVKQPIIFKSAKEQKNFNNATNISGWVRDEQGVHSGGWGLTLTCEDLVKIGSLYLHDGVWETTQLISKEWIKESTSKHNHWSEIDRGYGYLWWLNDEAASGFSAMGDGGNILYVNKKKRLVISSTSRFVPQVKDRIELIKQEIEPYV